MNTPICDFVRAYAAGGSLRLHMPGHKGTGPLGFETLDITEIPGADSLCDAHGIIRESEKNASRLFGAETFYSAEGSSLCIRAMVYLACLHARQQGKTPCLAAGRNAHKTLVSAAALLDPELVWLVPKAQASYLSCPVTAEDVAAVLAQNPVTAVYLTAPDYLGCLPELSSIARVCREKGVLLLVDNAHGAYLKFLPGSLHPMDLGADLCCDSAHKTLPVLTGGAYLHVSPRLPELASRAKQAMALFGSTSPSYLILQSLDAANPCLAETFPRQLAEFLPMAAETRRELIQAGWSLYGTEPLKLTLRPASMGYTGLELERELAGRGIVCEFADPLFTVCMLTPGTGKDGLQRLTEALLSLSRRAPIREEVPAFRLPERVMSIREAALSPSETVSVEEARGRVLAAATVSCPPAVPLAVCGERLEDDVLAALRFYGTAALQVVK